MGRYGNRGRGMTAGDLAARMSSQDRPALMEAILAPSRKQFHDQVRAVVLAGRVSRYEAGSTEYSPETIVRFRAELHNLNEAAS